MIKYVMTATALRLFSATPQTRRTYLLLGNTVGQRRRIQHGLSEQYLERARLMLELCERYQIIQKGDRLLEIGTGWLHWEATILRLFYDVEVTLFDVWDNRQLGTYKEYSRQLETVIDSTIKMDQAQQERAHALLRQITGAASFEEVYAALGFRYVVNPQGTLEKFQDGSFALIFSSNVLEHVDESILPEFVQGFQRLLKVGGYSIHQIDLGDHLSYYDKGVSLKKYLSFSDRVWKSYFKNDIQYFNLVQRPQWLHLFQSADLELVAEEPILVDIGPIKVDRKYKDLDEQDLLCRTLRVVHRKTP